MKGKFLIAKPFLEDENFERSVVLICEYGLDGTFGLIVNQDANCIFSDFFENTNIDSKISYGGPVGYNTLHYLHKNSNVSGAVEVLPGVYWSGDFDEIQAFMHSGEIKKEDIRFFLGYSGWDTGQLDQERKTNTWIITDAKPEFIFETDLNSIWSSVLRSLGNEYIIMANTPRDIRLN